MGQFVIHRLGLAMVNLHTKFEVSKLTHYKDIKGNGNVETGVDWRTRGHPRSLTMSPFNTVHTTSYLTLIKTIRLSRTIFES